MLQTPTSPTYAKYKIMEPSTDCNEAQKEGTTMTSTRELIKLVQNKPALWNRHCLEYKDRIAKDKAWIEVYKEIEPAYDSLKKSMKAQIGAQITKKWYNIRDSYAKSRRSGAYKRSRPYIYSEMLSFLDTIYNLEEKDSLDTNERNYEAAESEHFENEIYLETEEPDESKRPRFDSPKRDDDSIVAVLANLIHKEEDEDRAFLKSLTPAVKSLSEDSKFEFRIQVLDLIKKLREKDGMVKIKLEVANSDSD